MNHRPASSARDFFLAITFLGAFFLSSKSACAQEKPGSGDKIMELKEKRLVLLVKIQEGTMKEYFKLNTVDLDKILRADADLFAARLDLAEKKDDRIKICEETVKHAEGLEKRLVFIFNAASPDSNVTLIEVNRLRVYVLEVRIALEKAKAAK